jgi:hypothetical protein
MPKAVSKLQAALFGAIAGGKLKKKGMSAHEAKKRLRGVKVSQLPHRKSSK